MDIILSCCCHTLRRPTVIVKGNITYLHLIAESQFRQKIRFLEVKKIKKNNI